MFGLEEIDSFGQHMDLGRWTDAALLCNFYCALANFMICLGLFSEEQVNGWEFLDSSKFT